MPRRSDLTASYKHLSRTREEVMNLLLGSGIDHVHRPFAVGAKQTRCGPEKAANQWPLAVYITAVLTQVRTTQFGKRFGMFGFGLDRQPCHLFRRGRHRSATVVATDDAAECRNASAQFVNFPIIGTHEAGAGLGSL